MLLKRSSLAPQVWFTCLIDYLLCLGFNSTSANTSLYIQVTRSFVIIMLIFVDDWIVTGNNISSINSLIRDLNQVIVMKGFGPLNYILGVEIIRSPTAIYLCQAKYITYLLRCAHMDGAKPLGSPVVSLSPNNHIHESHFQTQLCIGALLVPFCMSPSLDLKSLSLLIRSVNLCMHPQLIIGKR